MLREVFIFLVLISLSRQQQIVVVAKQNVIPSRLRDASIPGVDMLVVLLEVYRPNVETVAVWLNNVVDPLPVIVDDNNFKTPFMLLVQAFEQLTELQIPVVSRDNNGNQRLLYDTFTPHLCFRR